MATKAHLEGNARYLQKFDNVVFRVPKGKRDEYKAHAESVGKSLNAYVVDLIEKDIETSKK